MQSSTHWAGKGDSERKNAATGIPGHGVLLFVPSDRPSELLAEAKFDGARPVGDDVGNGAAGSGGAFRIAIELLAFIGCIQQRQLDEPVVPLQAAGEVQLREGLLLAQYL